MVCLPLVVLLMVGVECTLSWLAGTKNMKLAWDMFLIKMCLQHIGTHFMVLLTDVITFITLVGHLGVTQVDTLKLTCLTSEFFDMFI